MSKPRNDYEYVGWRRFVHWVNGDPKEDYMPKEQALLEHELQEDSKHSSASQQENTSLWLKRVGEDDSFGFLKKAMDWVKRFGAEKYAHLYRVVAVLVCVAITTVLLFTISFLPEFGKADDPVNNEVSQRYLEDGLKETGATNMVAGMILDYRAFDTLGESHVLFIAVISVIILLRVDPDSEDKSVTSKLQQESNDRKFEPKNDAILQKAAFLLVPIIMLFGIYVILNGHLSPGGGFSGGAIIGAGLILYLNAFGFEKTGKFFTYKTFKWTSFVALSCYALSKGYSFFTGANHLPTGIPLGTPGNILSAGLILPLDICVGAVVACTMYAFYTLFRKGGM